MTIKVTDLADKQSAFEAMSGSCHGCQRCEIGGRKMDGSEWVEADGNGCLSNVFSNMNFDARIMVVGQNPGSEEVAKEEPFVGPSGKIFEKALKDFTGLSRSDLYITNTVKCYTPANRKPSQFEVDNCRDFLDLEIKLIEPLLVIALGSYAFKTLTGMSGIVKHSGSVVTSPRYLVPVLGMLHPSPFNTNHPERKELFYEAMVGLQTFLEENGWQTT